MGEFEAVAILTGQVEGEAVVPVALDYFAAYFAGEVVEVGGEFEDDARDFERRSEFVAGS